MNKDRRAFFRYWVAVLLISALHTPLYANTENQPGADIPAIAIIIYDLGNGYQRDKRAVLLPGKLSYAFLPHTPHTQALANLAHTLLKDVLLTQQPGHMQWLKQAIANTGNLFFIDSFTASESIAYKIASENWVPNVKRDVFLDSVRQPAAIHREFHRLLGIARKNGIALAIGHPYPETLTALETLLPTLPQQGIHLVPVSQLVKLETQRIQTWRASLSH